MLRRAYGSQLDLTGKQQLARLPLPFLIRGSVPEGGVPCGGGGVENMCLSRKGHGEEVSAVVKRHLALVSPCPFTLLAWSEAWYGAVREERACQTTDELLDPLIPRLRRRVVRAVREHKLDAAEGREFFSLTHGWMSSQVSLHALPPD
ncbi:hypothetical protein E2C01_039985 [Portunus trituberculatus]|uniref:Uncharacterized protein n=1 Tax=Portunus trituberculatus TaxID=210409 RepID=A0A5B7FG72_PORTR|nr:hypothetical protein [Portunus trituberculatus]